jgi:glutamine amidotransferase
MCELLGLAFNRPVSPGFSFRGFRHRAEHNDHGWGIAAIAPQKTTIHKEPIDARESDIATQLPDRDPLHAPLFIGHVRKASKGIVSLANTHPFSRPLDEGTLVLAHNGTLPDMRRLKKLAGPEFTPAGQTDSELILGALLAWIDRERAKAGTAHVPPPAKKSASTSVAQAATDHTAEPISKPLSDPLSDYRALEDFLREVNDLGNMNLLFSDGRRLFCYHDINGYNGLSWTRRQAPFPNVNLLDEEWSGTLAEDKARNQRGYVIASRPLTAGEPWRPCGHGRLMVIKHGDAVFGADVPGNAP